MVKRFSVKDWTRTREPKKTAPGLGVRAGLLIWGRRVLGELWGCCSGEEEVLGELPRRSMQRRNHVQAKDFFYQEVRSLVAEKGIRTWGFRVEVAGHGPPGSVTHARGR